MAVLRSDDPADGLDRVCRALSLYVEGDMLLTDGYEATRRDFEDIGLGTFGPCVLVVGDLVYDWMPARAFEGFSQGMAFFASENWGGSNVVYLYEGGQRVAAWEEEGERDEHPLLADLPEDLHPFDRIGRVAERLLGVPPLQLLDRPLFRVRRSQHR